MNNLVNTRVFLALVRAGLWGLGTKKLELRTKIEEVGCADDVDWDEVYRLAEEQSVVGLVAAGIEELRAVGLRTVEL